MSTPYRTLFVGELIQVSALSVGGNHPDHSYDESFCRDGLGRTTLRGQTLAGALLATARKLYGNDLLGIESLLGTNPKARQGAGEGGESLWHFFHAHPDNFPLSHRGPEARQGVGIRQATGAAAGGVLFDVETIPRGTRWPFLLEIDTSIPEGKTAEKIAAGALREWARGRCWIGRSVARGLGWLRLDKLKAYQLTIEKHLHEWPDSHQKPVAAVDALVRERKVKDIPLSKFGETFQLSKELADERWCLLELEGEINLTNQTGYGLDALSVGGHASLTPQINWNKTHFLAPESMKQKAYQDYFQPDSNIAMTRALDGKLEPFLPGAGLRGPLRHALSRIKRREGEKILDPNTPEAKSSELPLDKVGELFGTLEHSAALLICDAYLTPTDKTSWSAALLEHHAEDEFSAGVYAASKFDRLILLQGSFTWRMVIEAKEREIVETYRDALTRPLMLASHNHLPLGGGKWRGVGWPQWSVTQAVFSYYGAGDNEKQVQKEWLSKIA